MNWYTVEKEIFVKDLILQFSLAVWINEIKSMTKFSPSINKHRVNAWHILEITVH